MRTPPSLKASSAAAATLVSAIWVSVVHPRRLMDAILQLQGVSTGHRAASVAVWLFSPFTAAISSRGSGEAIITVLLLTVLLLLFKGAKRHEMLYSAYSINSENSRVELPRV